MRFWWLDELYNSISSISEGNTVFKHTASLSFLENFREWYALGEDQAALPFVFDPLFSKSVEIIRNFALAAPGPIPSVIKEKISDLDRKISICLLIHEDDEAKKIIETALIYGSLETSGTLSMIYSYWFGVIAVAYDIIFNKYNIGFPHEVDIPGDIQYWPWAVKLQKQSIKLERECIKTQGGLCIPLSWGAAQWLIFELLLSSGIGPFSKQFYKDDFPITWLLSKMVIEDPEDGGILLSKYTKIMPEQFSISMTITQEKLRFRYTWNDNAGTDDFLKAAFATLYMSEFILDATIDIVKKTWSQLRGKEETDFAVSADGLSSIKDFISRQEKFVSKDKKFRSSLRGVSESVHPSKQLPENEIKKHSIYKQIDKELNKWRSPDFGVFAGNVGRVDKTLDENVKDLIRGVIPDLKKILKVAWPIKNIKSQKRAAKALELRNIKPGHLDKFHWTTDKIKRQRLFFCSRICQEYLKDKTGKRYSLEVLKDYIQKLLSK